MCWPHPNFAHPMSAERPRPRLWGRPSPGNWRSNTGELRTGPFWSEANGASRDNFRHGALMSRVVRPSFAAVENLPSLEIVLQFARLQAMRRRLFTGLRDMNDRNQGSTRHDSLFCRFKEISLQVVADRDEIPTGRLNLVFGLFEVRDSCAYYDAALGSSTSKNFDSNRRAIHGRDAPPLRRKPKRIVACSAGQVERLARRQLLCSFHQKWRRHGV